MILSTPLLRGVIVCAFLVRHAVLAAKGDDDSSKEPRPTGRNLRPVTTRSFLHQPDDYDPEEHSQRFIVRYKLKNRNSLKQDMDEIIIDDGRKMTILYDFDTLDGGLDEDLEAFVVASDEATKELLKGNSWVYDIIDDDPRDLLPPYVPPGTSRRVEENNRNLIRDDDWWDELPEYEAMELKEQVVPYGVKLVQAPQVWEQGFKGAGVKVCVIDQGIDIDHEDLDGGIIGGNELQLAEHWPWYMDLTGHGTHVSGTIAALDNDIGVVGVAPEASIHMVIYLGGKLETGLYVSDMVKGIQLCIEADAKIINMSFGSKNMNEFEYDFFNKLRRQNVLAIASAGNRGDGTVHYPAAYPQVMSVSAVDKNKVVAEFSTKNQHVDISAPGVEVLSTMPMGFYPAYLCYQFGLPYKYSYLDGTSMAAPHVAGVAALLWSAEPNATAKQIQDAIQKSAEDLGVKGKDPKYGHGLVAAADALKRLNKKRNKKAVKRAKKSPRERKR